MNSYTPMILTKEGRDKLQTELDLLVNTERKNVAQRIKEAKEQGDLSENAEYAIAKEDQERIENRILEIKEILREATLAEDGHGSDFVNIGNTVTLTNDGKTVTYTIVGANEADPANGKISNESPLGKACIGKKSGDLVETETPAGLLRYTIAAVK